MGHDEERRPDEDLLRRPFGSLPPVRPHRAERGLEPKDEAGDEGEEEEGVRPRPRQHVELDREEHRKREGEERRVQEPRLVLEVEPDEGEQSAQEGEPGISQQRRERQAAERPPEHAVRHVLAEVMDLGDEDDRCPVEQVAEDEQPGGKRRSFRELMAQREDVRSGRQGEQSSHPYSARDRVPVRPDHGDEGEPDEEESQDHQHAVSGRAAAYLVVVHPVDPADGAGLLEGDDLPVDPARHLHREILPEETDQAHGRTRSGGIRRTGRRARAPRAGPCPIRAESASPCGYAPAGRGAVGRGWRRSSGRLPAARSSAWLGDPELMPSAVPSVRAATAEGLTRRRVHAR